MDHSVSPKDTVTVENDVRALTLTENMFGAGRDAATLAVVTIGAGIGCGLFLNGRIVHGAHGVSGEIGHLPLAPAARMIALESVPCAIGAALAMTQFRPRDGKKQNIDRRIDRLSQDRQKVLATLVGAVFFAFNVAPTDEPWMMAMEAEHYHFPLIVLFSLAVSYVIVFEADFAERPGGYTVGSLGNPHAETLVAYLLSLGVSYAFLVGFGHMSSETPVYAQLRATVMLGYVTTIGGSAGRILVAG